MQRYVVPRELQRRSIDISHHNFRVRKLIRNTDANAAAAAAHIQHGVGRTGKPGLKRITQELSNR